jgi:sulfur carrier protein ThiS
MEIKIKNYGEESVLKKTKSSDIKGLLIELSVNPETVIVRLNNEIVTLDMNIQSGDDIEIIPVVSGG